jgi:hypothetical protein
MSFEDMVEFLFKGAHKGKWPLIFDHAVDWRPMLPWHSSDGTTRNPDLGRLNMTVHYNSDLSHPMKCTRPWSVQPIDICHQEVESTKQLES